MFVDMLCCQRLQHCVDLCLGFFLFIAGLQQVEAAAADSEMTNLNWKPFIYGGMASIVAEFGTEKPVDGKMDGPKNWAGWKKHLLKRAKDLGQIFTFQWSNSLNIQIKLQ
ncbi:hypothetical protein CHARACLAT_025118 [Characodon lateralis]|uniref:Uncharacterized protein n=1 Tax=Characodon lateralis TaxID=208331 RepID=A0ABU7DX65_9TELE|nr:hypothetical protein [Characodon lateralis]